MYHFGAVQRAALQKLPEVMQLAIARWTELTHDDTHPALRSRPETGSLTEAVDALITAIRKSDNNDTYDKVTRLSGILLSNGFVRSWQHGAVKGYLLDPDGEHQATPLLDRLCVVASGSSTRPVTESAPVQLEWLIAPYLPKSFRLPWKDPQMRLGASGATYTLLERGKGNKRQWLMATTCEFDSARRITGAAAAMKAEVSAVVDLLRIVFADARTIRPSDISVISSALLSHVRTRALPSVRSRGRSTASSRKVLQIVTREPNSEIAARLLGACRWFSTAVLRWEESPIFATALLWMALEAIFGKCVIRHHRDCKDTNHVTAIDIYRDGLLPALALDIQEYVLTLRAMQSAAARPTWFTRWISRGNETVLDWIKRIRDRIPAQDEPFLKWRCDVLLNDSENVVDVAVANAREALLQLKIVRNSLAHEGDPQSQDETADYLASVATEILFLVFDNPHRLSVRTA